MALTSKLPSLYEAKLTAARAAKKEEEDNKKAAAKSMPQIILPPAGQGFANPVLPTAKSTPTGSKEITLPTALTSASKSTPIGNGVPLPKYTDIATRLKNSVTPKPELSLPLTREELFGDPITAAKSRELLTKSANEAGINYGVGKDGTMRAITQNNNYDSLFMTSQIAAGLGTSLLNIANTVGAVPSGMAKATEIDKVDDNTFKLPTKKMHDQKYAEGAAQFVENSPMTRAIKAVENASQRLYEKTSKNPLVTFGGEVSYNIGSMLPAVLATAASGGAGAPAALGQLMSAGLIAASSYSSALREAKEEGASDTDAANYAMLMSFVEGAGDMIIGGVAGLGSGAVDTMTKGALTNIASRIKHPMLRAAASYLVKNVIGEGIEEGLQEIGGVAARRATYDRDAQIDWKDVGTAAAMGGAIGGIFGAFELPGEYNASSLASIGAEINSSPQRVQALVNETLERGRSLLPGGESSRVIQLAAELDAKIKAGEKVSDAEVGELYYLNAEEKTRAASDYNAEMAYDMSNRGIVLPKAGNNQYSIKGIEFTQSQLNEGIKKVAQMQPVTTLSWAEFQKSETDLVTQVSRYFDSIGNVAHSPQLGEVILDSRGIKDSIAHGLGRIKAASFAAVPAVIERGAVIDYQTNWKGRRYDTAVISAPAIIGDKSYLVGVILIRKNNSNRFYVHEVLTQENGTLPFKTGAAVRNSGLPGGNVPSLISILQKVKDVKYNSQNLTSQKFETDISEKEVAAVKRIAAKFNREVEFYSSDSAENGYYANGKIYINAASKNPVLVTFAHELTHSVEGADAYNSLRSYVQSKLGDGLEAAREEIVQRYARHGVQLAAEADIDAELVADYLQKHLLTDEDAITSLVTTDKTLGQRILEWINNVIVKLTGTPEQKEMLRVRGLYEKALKQAGKTDSNVKYSVDNNAESTSPETPDGLRGKAKEEVDRAVRVLTGKLAQALSVPYGEMRGHLVPMAERLATEYIQTGSISPDSINNIFEEAYERGRITNEEYINENKELKAQLRNTAITLSPRDRADMGDYEAFRKRNFGILKLVNEGGLPIDTFYAELSEMYPSMFPDDIAHPADQLELIAKVSSSLSRAEYNLDTYYGPDAEMFKQSARRAFEESVSDFLPRLNRVKRYVDDLNVRAQRLEKARQLGNMALDENMPRNEKLQMLKAAYENAKVKREATAEVVRRNLLTEVENAEVERLLSGVIKPEDIARSEDYDAIIEVYNAKKALQTAEAPIKMYNSGRKAALFKQAEDIIGDIMSWKDKSAGFMYARETFERNIRDIAPDADTAERMIKTYREPIMKNERSATKYKNKLRDAVRELDISQRVLSGNRDSEAAAVQFIGEYESKLEQMQRRRGKDEHGKTYEDYEAELRDFKAANPKFDYNEIRRKVQRMRQIYDALHERINESRMLNGYAPVPYRKGYFPHFKDDAPDTFIAKLAKDIGIDVSGDTLPTTINGLTQDFKPGIRWASFALQRNGTETTYDALQGFDRYIEVAADVIFHTADIQRLRALSAQIRLMTANEGLKMQAMKILSDEALTPEEQHERIVELFKNGKYQLSNFVTDLDEYTNILAGKKSSLDRGVEAMLGRRFYKIVKSLESRVAANMVAINPGSWLTNFIPLHQAASQIETKHMVRGMYDTLRAYKDSDFITDASAFLVNRRGADPLVMTLSGKVSEVLSKPMSMIDTFVAGTVVRARYNQNISAGMDSATALNEADSFAASVMAGRSKGDMPTIFASKNPVIKLFTQFQLEVNNELSYILKDIPREQRDKGAAALAMALLKYAVGAFLFNEWYERLVGRRAAFDVLGILKGAGEDISSGVGTAQAIENLGGEIAQNIPFIGGLLGGGRLPIQVAIPDVSKAVTAAANYADKKITLPKAASVIGRELVKPAAYLLPPFGGGQALKTAQGISAVANKGVYTMDNEGNKQLQYPVTSDNPLEAALYYAKGAVFGKTAFDSAQKWINGGFGSESAKTTSVYQLLVNSGYPGTEVYNTLMAVKEGAKTEEKLGALESSSLDENGKAVIYRALLATDKEASVYDTLESKKEDLGTLWQTLVALRTADKTDEKSASEVKKDLLDMSTLSDESKAYIYRRLLASKKEGEMYDYLMRNGADSISSYKLAYSLYKAGSAAEKYSIIADAQISDEAKVLAFRYTAPDSVTHKYNIAQAYGVTIDTWLLAYIMLDENGAGDSISKDKIEKVLKLMMIPKNQKAAIWQLMNKSWKPESNPYSATVGRAVVAAMNGGTLLPAAGGRIGGKTGGRLVLPGGGN